MSINSRNGNTLLNGGSFAPCRVATIAAIALTGLQTIDGKTLIEGDRVLVKNQADTTTNGIYAASTSAWTRATDAASNSQFFLGMTVTIAQGSVNAGQIYACTATDDPVVVGTSTLTFAALTSLQSTTFTNPTIVGTLTATAGGTLGGTFAGNPIFSGTPTFSAGAAISGTFSGAATFSGALTLSAKLSLTSTDSMAMAKGTTAQRNGSPAAGDVRYNTTLGCLEYYNGTVWIGLGRLPTVQRLLTATSGTFTPSTGAVLFLVELWAPGAGGPAAVTNSGGAATANSAFKDWTAVKGSPGTVNGAGGIGGTGGTNGTGTLIDRVDGGDGNHGASNNHPTGDGQMVIAGGMGGANPRGGAGAVGAANGGSAKANSGGGGAAGQSTTASNPSGGGGAGEWVKFWITAQQLGATCSYTIGGKGTGGAAGTNAGGDGADGGAIVTEYYA